MQLRRGFHSGVNKRGDNVCSLRSNETGVTGATRSCVQRFIHYTSLSGPAKHRRSSDAVVVVARFSVTQRHFPRRANPTCLDNRLATHLSILTYFNIDYIPIRDRFIDTHTEAEAIRYSPFDLAIRA